MQSYGFATPRIGKTTGKPKPPKAKPSKKRGR
jgi:hypothetical protein